MTKSARVSTTRPHARTLRDPPGGTSLRSSTPKQLPSRSKRGETSPDRATTTRGRLVRTPFTRTTSRVCSLLACHGPPCQLLRAVGPECPSARHPKPRMPSWERASSRPRGSRKRLSLTQTAIRVQAQASTSMCRRAPSATRLSRRGSSSSALPSNGSLSRRETSRTNMWALGPTSRASTVATRPRSPRKESNQRPK